MFEPAKVNNNIKNGEELSTGGLLSILGASIKNGEGA
jgi:hypothetical protein